jgi:hypothetical protein
VQGIPSQWDLALDCHSVVVGMLLVKESQGPAQFFVALVKVNVVKLRQYSQLLSHDWQYDRMYTPRRVLEVREVYVTNLKQVCDNIRSPMRVLV